MLREQYVAGLQAQHEGLVLTQAAAAGIAAPELSAFMLRLFETTAHALETRSDVGEVLEARRERNRVAFGAG